MAIASFVLPIRERATPYSPYVSGSPGFSCKASRYSFSLSNLRGINDFGVVVGFTTNPAGGFVGSDARGYQWLVPPGGEVPGNVTFCQGINNLDQVVCAVTDSEINPLGAFIGSPVRGQGDAD
jgi:hypothetical protein